MVTQLRVLVILAGGLLMLLGPQTRARRPGAVHRMAVHRGAADRRPGRYLASQAYTADRVILSTWATSSG
jgi:hypothetical protein